MSLRARAPIGATDHVLGAMLGFIYLAVLLGTAGDIGMSRDESFYVIAAESYAPWFEQLWNDPDGALTTGSIDHHWRYNHEHPGLIKGVFALFWLAQEKLQIFEQPSQAFRLGGMISAALLLWLTYIFGARAGSRRIGIFAALSLATLPRVFYHSHLNCFDVPIVLMMTWTVYCYWRSLKAPWWAVWTGISFGCALATKHNAWVLPGVLLIHWLWVGMNERNRRQRGRPARVTLTPYWLLAMLLISPWIFLGTWPWLWHETLPRIGAYAAFHLRHDYYNMVYFGTNYFEPPFPIAFPFVLTAYTVPATTLVLMLLGLGIRARAMLPIGWLERLWPGGQLRADSRATDILWLGCALSPLVVIALPNTPIFGGTKHWFPAYPFLALFAGHAASRVLLVVESWYAERWRGARDWLAPPVLGLLLLPGLMETAHSHPFGLSHYTMLAGGVPGAADLGMNRQFWGFTTGSVVGFLNEALPEGGRVFLHDTTEKAWQMLQRDGRLSPRILPARRLPDADYVLVQHEDHMAEVDFQAWTAFGSVQPAYVLHYDGVPIVSIYAHPRRRD